MHQFLGDKRAGNYAELVGNLIKSFRAIGYRISLKISILHANLEKFKDNMGAYSEEHEERFHQDIKEFEERYMGQYTQHMMADYIWSLVHKYDGDHRRKSRKKSHF